MVDSRIIPLNPVASDGHSTVRHASDELDVWGLVFGTKLDACLSGVVQKLVVANPERSVPSFVVFPTVHGVLSRVPLYYGIKNPPCGVLGDSSQSAHSFMPWVCPGGIIGG